MYTRDITVLHGKEQAGLFANRPASAPNGHRFYADDLQRGFSYDSQRKLWFPEDGGLYYSASQNFMVDHFRSLILDSQYVLNSGADAQAVDPAILTTAMGGILQCASGDVGDTYANDNSQICLATFLSPEDGATVFAARCALDVITAAQFFIGLTDSTAEEETMSLATTTLTTTATNAVGFLFDTDATVDNIWLCGVADDVDATHIDSGLAPVAATYRDYLIELSAIGTAKFWIDGTLVGTMAGAVAADSDLTPKLAVNSHTTAARVLSADFWACQQSS